MEIKSTFLERDEKLFARFGHLVEGIKSFNEETTFQDQNKALQMLDSAVREEYSRNGKDYNSLTDEQFLEQTDTGDMATNIQTTMAMIGKVFPNLITKGIMSIQPLKQNGTNIYYRDIQREDGTSLSSGIHTNRTYANNVEYDPSSPTAIKNISMKITKDTISTTEKKLINKVTMEVQQDMIRDHGISAKVTLDSAMFSEIVREWDRTNIQNMIDGATGGSATFSTAEPSGLTYADRKYWMETLYEKFIDVDNQILKKRYRKTNFIVCGADESAFISKMSGFKATEVDVTHQVVATGGRYEMGTLSNQWKIIVDPFLSGTILMGYNNPGNWLETSYVFAPYIMSYFSPEFVNPETLVRSRAMMSRCGAKVVQGDLLGTVTVTSS